MNQRFLRTSLSTPLCMITLRNRLNNCCWLSFGFKSTRGNLITPFAYYCYTNETFIHDPVPFGLIWYEYCTLLMQKPLEGISGQEKY